MYYTVFLLLAIPITIIESSSYHDSQHLQQNDHLKKKTNTVLENTIVKRPTQSTQPVFGFLDGFGTSKVIVIHRSSIKDDISSSSILSDIRPKPRMKHKVATALTFSLMASIFSFPLWNNDIRSYYWTTVIIVYILYLLESMFSSTRKYLSNALTPSELSQTIQTLCHLPLELKWNIENYHYDRYSDICRQQRRTNDSRTKVVTHRASQQYQFSHWTDKTDISSLLQALDYDQQSKPFLKLSMGKLILFQDALVYQDFQNQYYNFLQREGNRDDHSDITTTISAPGIYRPKFLIIRTVIGVLDHARLASFWLCTVFGFTVPYRQWFERHCDSIDTVLVKEVYS